MTMPRCCPPILLMLVLIVASGGSVSAQSHRPAPAASWTVSDVRAIAVDGEPMALSPDGRWLAGPGLDGDFCVWDAVTLDPTCDGRDLPPVIPRSIAWAPDSSAVAFSVDTPTLLIDSDVLVFEVATGTLVNLTGDEAFARVDLDRENADPIPVDLFPAWSPGSDELVFARTMWGPGAMGTTLMTIARAGGEPETLHAIWPRMPFLVFTPMRWLEDGSILYSHLGPPDVEERANGIWRLPAEGRVEQVISGSVTNEIALPEIVAVSPDGTTISVVSLTAMGMSQFEVPRRYFLVDLATGDTTSVETLAGRDGTPEEMARADSGGFLAAPARFAPDGATMVSIATIGTDADLLLIDAERTVHEVAVPGGLAGEGFVTVRVSELGIDWAANDTLFIGLVGGGEGGEGQGGGLLLTLERGDAATPLPPCGCTPPALGQGRTGTSRSS